MLNRNPDPKAHEYVRQSEYYAVESFENCIEAVWCACRADSPVKGGCDGLHDTNLNLSMIRSCHRTQYVAKKTLYEAGMEGLKMRTDVSRKWGNNEKKEDYNQGSAMQANELYVLYGVHTYRSGRTAFKFERLLGSFALSLELFFPGYVCVYVLRTPYCNNISLTKGHPYVSCTFFFND
ncbi:uncharacterized protein CIMG_11847 [Coccidioides immitis RS]|uniref:Uncharacterized protein n=1 Tax=Coccidioides immitis (strain RS) TaxID=246410 RepID=A0A0E1S235_COCIM|nr:uncharacterized protein CIMG_11847 [Coccidioides immitis RS]EAS31338.2 hypothetical protein CIMG_11847 [Coccidioides immitis RS]